MGKYGFCPSSCPASSSSSTTTTTTTSSTTTTVSSGTTTTTITTSTTTSTSTTTTTTTASSGTCTTSSVPAAGQPCVFPFTFSGVTYNSCADWIYGGQPSGTTWCSTKVKIPSRNIIERVHSVQGVEISISFCMVNSFTKFYKP